MKTQIISRISKKVQMAAAGVAVASSLAVLAPMTASAQYANAAACEDWTGPTAVQADGSIAAPKDGRVDLRDVVFVVRNYRTDRQDGSGAVFGIADVLQAQEQAMAHFNC